MWNFRDKPKCDLSCAEAGLKPTRIFLMHQRHFWWKIRLFLLCRCLFFFSLVRTCLVISVRGWIMLKGNLHVYPDLIFSYFHWNTAILHVFMYIPYYLIFSIQPVHAQVSPVYKTKVNFNTLQLLLEFSNFFLKQVSIIARPKFSHPVCSPNQLQYVFYMSTEPSLTRVLNDFIITKSKRYHQMFRAVWCIWHCWYIKFLLPLASKTKWSICIYIFL